MSLAKRGPRGNSRCPSKTLGRPTSRSKQPSFMRSSTSMRSSLPRPTSSKGSSMTRLRPMTGKTSTDEHGPYEAIRPGCTKRRPMTGQRRSMDPQRPYENVRPCSQRKFRPRSPWLRTSESATALEERKSTGSSGNAYGADELS